MKMKQITVLMIGTSLALTVLSEEMDTVIPRLNQLKEIRVSPYRWRGTFYPNGAAKLDGGIGSGSPVKAVAPKGSFSFEKTYALLLPHLCPARTTTRWPRPRRAASCSPTARQASRS